MGRADNIQAEFPPGVSMPGDLRRLCDYLDRTDYPLSGYITAWFDGDDTTANQFAGFGSGPDGSVLAFWLYRGPDASTAPVIHLGSEGQNNVVLASDFQEFLHLLGIGYGELGFDDLSLPPAEPETAARLRKWLLAEFGITPPETGAALVRQAQERHPDLEAWFQDWMEKHNWAK